MACRARMRIAASIAGALALLIAMSTAQAANQQLPVPTVTIYPGDVISSNLLVDKAFRAGASRLPVFQSRDGLVGKVARRTLIPGKPIPINSIRDPQVIKQGKAVRVIFTTDGLTIAGLAVALQSGGVGDIISLRNVDSGVVIRGEAQADGTVRLLP